MIGVTHLFSAYLHRITFWTGHISLCPLSFSVERAHCVPFLPCRILGTEPGTACRSPGAPSMAGPRPWSLLQVSAAGIYYHQPLYLFQAPPSLGFSRQEHWSGLPFPSPMHESEKWKWSHSVVSYPQQPHGLQPSRLLHPWDFPGKSTGMGCHCLLPYVVRS